METSFIAIKEQMSEMQLEKAGTKVPRLQGNRVHKLPRPNSDMEDKFAQRNRWLNGCLEGSSQTLKGADFTAEFIRLPGVLRRRWSRSFQGPIRFAHQIVDSTG